MAVYYAQTSLGLFRLASNGEALTGCRAVKEKKNDETLPDGVVKAAAEALNRYFHGEITKFALPLRPAGTSFEMSVWREIQKIPYGQTICYSDIARSIGKEKAIRAVGRATGKNPLWIFIPCHRVIGKNKALTGYAGGLEMKEKLLKLEGAISE